MAVFYVVCASTRFFYKRVVAQSKRQAETIAYDTKEGWTTGYDSDVKEHYQTIPKKEIQEEGAWWSYEAIS
jgi:hypothetical protein